MTDPYSSFDTFTVGGEADGPSPEPTPPPVLARLPRVQPEPPKPKTRQRFDDAETLFFNAHLHDAPLDVEVGDAPAFAPALPGGDDPFATIRIDTVAPTAFVDAGEAVVARPNPQPAVVPFEEGDEATDDALTTWMLNAESALQPYARWIALAAVVAALGLTAVLLTGGGGASPEAVETAPQVRADAAGGVLADASSDSTAPAFETTASWPAPTQANEPSVEDGLRPLDASPPPAVAAAGPASAARASGRATLTGEVWPLDTQRVDVADAAQGPNYPQTR